MLKTKKQAGILAHVKNITHMEYYGVEITNQFVQDFY